MSYIIKFLLFFYTLNTYAQIYINEIYPAPLKNQSEWIELVNPSESEISFEGFIISNRNTRLIIDQSVSLPPQSFLILLKDTNQIQSEISCNYICCNLPPLHNDWDAIAIYSLD
ncbi:MAG: lamin tail domain-containing protein, partial [Candidatus Kapaibacteriota bacterium]